MYALVKMIRINIYIVKSDNVYLLLQVRTGGPSIDVLWI